MLPFPRLASAEKAVYEGSFLDFDWSDGDVVFANSTCFDDELMIDMSEKATKLKAGAIVVTFTKVKNYISIAQLSSFGLR